MPVLKAKYNGEWINVSGGSSSGGASVQSNWDQNDSTQLDYIKNRTHYDVGDFIEVELLPAEDLSFEYNPPYGYVTFFSLVPPLKLGQQYLVIIDGERYIETAVTNEIMGGISLGESIMKLFLSLEAGMPVTYSKPFIIMQEEDSNEIMMVMLQSSESIHNVSISLTGQYLHKELYKVSNEKFDYMNGQYGKYLWDFSDKIVVGLDYKVIWDSTEYICKATALDPEGMYIIIGNASMMGGEDTGEPFAFMVVTGMLSAFMDLENIYTPETNKSVSITIDKQLEDGSYENLITVTDFTLVYDNNMSVYESETELEGVLETNSTYKVTYAGNEYICSSLDIEGTVSLGNPSIIPEIAILGNTGEPFLMGYNPDSGIFVYESMQAPEVSHSIEFSGYVSGVKKLDKKYLPNDMDLPIASYSKEGVVKVRDSWSGLGSSSDYTPIYLDTDDNQIYAKARSSMSTLTFTGATSGSYNGSSPVTINIPTGVPTVSTSDNGKVLGVVNGAWAKYDLPIQEMNPLTFTGLVEGTYDGSQALTINIPIVRNSVVFLDQTTGEDYSVYVDNGQIVCKAVSEVLMDFDYTRNDDGTYTINSWKGTLNGETSTECVVPSTIVTIVE